MSRDDITHKLMCDEDFLSSVRSDPTAVLDSYDLPENIVDAIEKGDEDQLRSVLDLEYGAGVPNQGPVEGV